MGYRSFQDLLDLIRGHDEMKKFTISVAFAGDREILAAVKQADEIGLASAVLVGDGNELHKIAPELNIDLDRFGVIDEPDPIKAFGEAVRQIKIGRADCLMKGLVNTSDFIP